MCQIYDTFWLSAHSACLEDAMRELLYLFQSSFPHLLPDPKTWTFLQYCIRSSEANWLLAWTDKHYERLRAELSVPCTTKNISQKALTMQIFRHRRTPILAEPGSSSALSESSCTDLQNYQWTYESAGREMQHNRPFHIPSRWAVLPALWDLQASEPQKLPSVLKKI